MISQSRARQYKWLLGKALAARSADPTLARDYEELLKRDKLSLDLFWIRDKSLTDTDSLPPPEILATEIADDLEAALEQFTKIAARLKAN